MLRSRSTSKGVIAGNLIAKRSTVSAFSKESLVQKCASANNARIYKLEITLLKHIRAAKLVKP